ncbi:disulfide bond formation protein B [Hydrogenophaga soli]|nr:disulfide bond formation protein B [Burkholderiaceae bacterium]
MIQRFLAEQPARVMAALAALCLGLLAFGMYLQHVVGLEPCPMCIVQRYALVLVGLAALAASVVKAGALRLVFQGELLLMAGFGAFVAARQSWLQWNPPEVASCGRDLYGMIENFPLQRVIPMVFKGSGDCAAVDWTFLSLTIANWSFLNFVFIAAVTVAVLVCNQKRS